MGVVSGTGRWKRHEREIAEALGSHRNPNTGEHRSDINAGPFAVEVKTRKVIPKWLSAAMSQSVLAAQLNNKGETPIVVLSVPRVGSGTERLVVMKFSDFCDWHGSSEGSAD